MKVYEVIKHDNISDKTKYLLTTTSLEKARMFYDEYLDDCHINIQRHAYHESDTSFKLVEYEHANYMVYKNSYTVRIIEHKCLNYQSTFRFIVQFLRRLFGRQIELD